VANNPHTLKNNKFMAKFDLSAYALSTTSLETESAKELFAGFTVKPSQKGFGLVLTKGDTKIYMKFSSKLQEALDNNELSVAQAFAFGQVSEWEKDGKKGLSLNLPEQLWNSAIPEVAVADVVAAAKPIVAKTATRTLSLLGA
jgi:hypothetical protein